jgi:hypothetical protein
MKIELIESGCPWTFTVNGREVVVTGLNIQHRPFQLEVYDMTQNGPKCHYRPALMPYLADLELEVGSFLSMDEKESLIDFFTENLEHEL